MKIPISLYTYSPISQKITQAFAKGCDGIWENVDTTKRYDDIATYGIKRGTNIALKQCNNFWYIDHGYFGKGDPQLCNGYYRIVRNGIIHDIDGGFPSDRFDKFNIKFKPWQKNGKYIILVPPSLPMGKFINKPRREWLGDTIEKLQKYTDRPIRISEKKYFPLPTLLKDAWILITDHSNSQIEALINGIPVITTSEYRKISSIQDVESPVYERDWIKNLAYHQWTVGEMSSGKTWRELKC